MKAQENGFLRFFVFLCGFCVDMYGFLSLGVGGVVSGFCFCGLCVFSLKKTLTSMGRVVRIRLSGVGYEPLRIKS